MGRTVDEATAHSDSEDLRSQDQPVLPSQDVDDHTAGIEPQGDEDSANDGRDDRADDDVNLVRAILAAGHAKWPLTRVGARGRRRRRQNRLVAVGHVVCKLIHSPWINSVEGLRGSVDTADEPTFNRQADSASGFSVAQDWGNFGSLILALRTIANLWRV